LLVKFNPDIFTCYDPVTSKGDDSRLILGWNLKVNITRGEKQCTYRKGKKIIETTENRVIGLRQSGFLRPDSLTSAVYIQFRDEILVM
jgi:hypothetical protein